LADDAVAVERDQHPADHLRPRRELLVGQADPRARGSAQCDREDVPAGDGFTETVWVGTVDVPGTLTRIEGLRG
jgi:hypothetical protein